MPTQEQILNCMKDPLKPICPICKTIMVECGSDVFHCNNEINNPNSKTNECLRASYYADEKCMVLHGYGPFAFFKDGQIMNEINYWNFCRSKVGLPPLKEK